MARGMNTISATVSAVKSSATTNARIALRFLLRPAIAQSPSRFCPLHLHTMSIDSCSHSCGQEEQRPPSRGNHTPKYTCRDVSFSLSHRSV
jgi:hypothetical protein